MSSYSTGAFCPISELLMQNNVLGSSQALNKYKVAINFLTCKTATNPIVQQCNWWKKSITVYRLIES